MKKIIISLFVLISLLLTGCQETSISNSISNSNEFSEVVDSSTIGESSIVGETENVLTINDVIVLSVYENGECLLLWDNTYFSFSHLRDPKVGDSYNLTFETDQFLQINSSFPHSFGNKLISYELNSSVAEKENMFFIQYVNYDIENNGFYIDEIIYYEVGTLLTDAVSSYANKKGTTLQDYFLSYIKDDLIAEMNPNYLDKYSLKDKTLNSNITVFYISF